MFFLCILSCISSFFLSTFSMEADLQFPKEIAISHQMDIKNCAEIPTLETLCIKVFEKLFKKSDMKAIPESLRRMVEQRVFLEWYRYQNAVLFYAVFGKRYKPLATPITMSQTKVSANKEYFFEFNESQTRVYRITSLGLEYITELKGKLLALSIDDTYLLLKYATAYTFIKFGSWTDIASYHGDFNKNSDVLVLNPNDNTCYLVKDFLEKIKTRGVWENFEDKYNADPNKLVLIRPEHYVFEIARQGIPLKYLLWGDRRTENGKAVFSLPQTIILSGNRRYALMECAITEDLEEKKDVALCKFATHEKFTFNEYARATACCPNGRYAIFGSGMSLTLTDFNKLQKGRCYPGNICVRHLKSSGWATKVAISPDGNFALILIDPGSWMGEPLSPEEVKNLTVHLCDLRSEKKGIYTLNSVVVMEGKEVSHIGFIDNGRHFFICSDQFYIYSMENFAPSSLASSDLEFKALFNIVQIIKSIEERESEYRHYDGNYDIRHAYLPLNVPILKAKKSELVVRLKAAIKDDQSKWFNALNVVTHNPELFGYVIDHFHLESPESYAANFSMLDSLKQDLEQLTQTKAPPHSGCIVS